MTAWLCTLAICTLASGQSADEPASELKLSGDCVVRFATVGEGQAALTADDAFTRSLSKFDLQSRLKNSGPVTLADWKEFASEHVKAWEPAEIKTVSESLGRLSKPLAELRLPLPRAVLLIRTTGQEEAGAAYTRGAAIVLPQNVLAYSAERLDRLLAHELFHVLSRHDGAFRSRLYRIIGFEICEAIEFPATLADRRLTNPDAPLVDCTIELKNAEGKSFFGAPILYASANSYNPEKKGSMFQYLTFRLLVVEQDRGRWRPRLLKGEPVVIDPKKEAAFFDKVGKNTNYVIHPDEILADNFVHLVMGTKDLATPRIVDEMRAALAK